MPSRKLSGLIALVGGLALFGLGLWLVSDSLDAGNWARTDGTVLSSDVETSFSITSFEFSYRPVVTFEYSVDGATYQAAATARSRTHSRDNLVGATSAAMDYPPGDPVQIFYRRANPARAALKPEPRNWHYWLLIVSLIVVIAGASMLRSRAGPNEAPGGKGGSRQERRL
jgi:hypothetical protein